MQLATCLLDGNVRLVRNDPDGPVLIHPQVGTSLRAILTEGKLDALQDAPAEPVDEDALTFLPPITDPEKILCIGLNFGAHALETGAGLPQYPSIFIRFPSSQVGHGQPVIAPSISAELDYEAELAVVIGSPAYRVSEADAMRHVAGYTCFAENSVRDYQAHARQVTAGKNFIGSGAMGPWLTTADAIPDPAALRVIGRLNGAEVQNDTIDHLVFSIPALIAYISSFTRLEPGDVISTGTPDGVGFLRDPKIYLQPGDVFEVNIPSVGLLSNTVKAEVL